MGSPEPRRTKPCAKSGSSTFFAGAITGAAFAYAFDWGGDDIDINVGGDNINIGGGDNVNIGNNVDTDRFNGDRVRGEGGDRHEQWRR